MSATDFFAHLRSESILQIFASIAKFFGLEVYEQGLDKVKTLKNLSNGSAQLLLGFPDCGSSYFLLIQLDKEFKPVFKLLETRPDSSGKAQSPNELLCTKKIDIDKMQVHNDFLNMSIRDWDKIFSVLSGAGGVPKQFPLPEVNIEGRMQISEYPPSSFSSVVDEVFELETGAPAPSFAVRNMSSSDIVSKNTGKRTFSDILKNIGILQDPEETRFIKKRKTAHFPQASPQTDVIFKGEGYSYGDLLTETNKENAPYNVYTSLLHHVVSHCSLCIKHARLTTQMEVLNISYQEEACLTYTSSNIWFQLPGELIIHLRLDKPGSTSWDVKINDQHFRDLSDLEKGSNDTPWGSGVSIANTSSNLDYSPNIHYDQEGVVLSYESIEPDSINKLAADITRLSNARTFALRMRKLLGDEKLRQSFKIEAVGLTSLWFSFGSGSLGRIAVEWESEKEGCRMHVSPNYLWPHTKFLEEFINGGEVASLLDCICLTAGPLRALAAATRPTRASPAPGAPAMVSAVPNVINAPLMRARHGIVPSLLPIDVSVVLRGPYWIRIVYRKQFAVDMRCFAGDQVWLQPATPPNGGPSVGGSLPCPQFRPFIMGRVAQELNRLDPNFSGGQQTVVFANGNNRNPGSGAQLSSANGNRVNSRVGNALSGGLPIIRRSQVRGELNRAMIGLGDDGGYGGGWVPLVVLKKVLRGVFKYLGALWLFAQLPDLLKEILKDNEGAMLNLDQELPVLRFFVRGCVFAVSVHRAQLQLQVLTVKRFNHQQQQNSSEKLTKSEINEICDYFSRRVASEPYDPSRVASFITLLTLPIPALKEFLKLIAWKKVGDDIVGPARIELSLENHSSLTVGPTTAKSNIHHDRLHNSVAFALTVVLDPAHVPRMNAATRSETWLPYCVSVRLRYYFDGNKKVTFLGMEGSHGGRACWSRVEEWGRCKQRVNRTVEVIGPPAGEISQGRLRILADIVQRTLHCCLQGLKDGTGITST